MVQAVRLMYAPFRHFVSGHICFVFKMQNGEEIVISPEAHTDSFNPWLGLLPYYKLRYRQITYQELVETYQHKNREFTEFDLDLDVEEANLLLRTVRERLSDLDKESEYYNIIFNSCLSNVHGHIREVTNICLGWRGLALPLKPSLLSEHKRRDNQHV